MLFSPVLVVQIICTIEGVIGTVLNIALLRALLKSRSSGNVRVYRVPIYISCFKGLWLSLFMAIMNYVNIFRDGMFVITLLSPIVPYLPRSFCDVTEQIGLVFMMMIWTIIPATGTLQWIAMSRAHWKPPKRLAVGFSFTFTWVVISLWLVPQFVPSDEFHDVLENVARDLYDMDNSTQLVMYGGTLFQPEINNSRNLITIVVFYVFAPYLSSYSLFSILVVLIRRRFAWWGVIFSKTTVQMQRDFFRMQMLQSFLPLAILLVPAGIFGVGVFLQWNLDFATLLVTYTLWLCPIVQAIVQYRFVRRSNAVSPEVTSTTQKTVRIT